MARRIITYALSATAAILVAVTAIVAGVSLSTTAAAQALCEDWITEPHDYDDEPRWTDVTMTYSDGIYTMTGRITGDAWGDGQRVTNFECKTDGSSLDRLHMWV